MDNERKEGGAPDSADAPRGADEARELREKLAQCEKARDEYLAGWQRAKADFSNYRKDEFRRAEETAKYATEDLICELIAILDNFDLGIRALERAGPVERGIYMIRARIEDALRKRGLARIAMKTGEPFDPSVAEAVAEVVSDHPAGTIVEEIEPGYKLYDRIVRPARVKISKGKSSS